MLQFPSAPVQMFTKKTNISGLEYTIQSKQDWRIKQFNHKWRNKLAPGIWGRGTSKTSTAVSTQARESIILIHPTYCSIYILSYYDNLLMP